MGSDTRNTGRIARQALQDVRGQCLDASGYPTVIVGVDPDLHGAAVFVNQDRKLEAFANFDLEPASELGGAKRRVNARAWAAAIGDLISPRVNYLALVEHPVIMPKGGAALSSQFYTLGVVTTVLSQHMPVIEVLARRWKGRLGIEGKDAARSHAFKLHPELFPKGWPRVKDTGLAEAALIAHYGWQILTEQ